MLLIEQIDKIISKHHLLNHIFYQAWSSGQLSHAALQTYAVQYYHQVKSFPRFISRVHTGCEEIVARKVLLENLIDEELHGTDHPALWMQFAEGLGVSSQSVKSATPIPETKAMVSKYYELAERDWRDGLVALYVYESQVPAVSASKIEGLQRFYNMTDEHAIEFFTAHQLYDVKHAQQVASLIEAYHNDADALQAAADAAQVLWGFLDGMCRISNVACH